VINFRFFLRVQSVTLSFHKKFSFPFVLIFKELAFFSETLCILVIYFIILSRGYIIIMTIIFLPIVY
jgi:hypothetical protein